MGKAASSEEEHLEGLSTGNFYTHVISADPRFDSVTRFSDALLEPTTRQLVEGIVSAARAPPNSEPSESITMA